MCVLKCLCLTSNPLPLITSQAGRSYSLNPGNPFWAAIDKEHWPANLEQDIAPLWHEPHGDRQQEIVIIGQQLDIELITNALNECLLSDEDMSKGLAAWGDVDDPFRDSWETAIQQMMNGGSEADHGHSHEHDHHH